MPPPSAPTVAQFEQIASNALSHRAPTPLLSLAHEAMRLRHPWAVRLARAAIEAGAPPAPAEYLLAQALRQAGNLPEAVVCFKRALAHEQVAPSPALRAEIHEQLAQIAQQQGETESALHSWQETLALRPDSPRIWNNLAMSWRAKGSLEDAERALREALRLDPNYALAWVNLGELRLDHSDIGPAIEAFERARSLDSKDFASRYQLGRSLVHLNRYVEAEIPLREAHALWPEHEAAHELLAAVLGQTGAHEQARAMHEKALARHPDRWNSRIQLALALPDIYRSTAHLAEARAAYAYGLAQLQERAEGWQAAPGERFDLRYSNFALAYQGMDDLPLQRAWAGVLETLAQKLAPELCSPLARRRPSGHQRIRVGFVSSMLRAHTVGHYFGPWIKELDPRRFEVYYYNLFRGHDAVVAALEARAAVTRRLPSATQTAAEVLRGDELDALIYPDLGMDYVASVLPAFRLAPVQLAAWGHPVTSGFSNIDGYLSCQEMEPADGASHYAEPLLLLPGIGTRYSLPEVPPAAARSAFGLAESARLYLNPQSLFKIHPENDQWLCELMVRDPHGVFLFFRDPSEIKTRAFADRLGRAMALRGIAPRGQVKFLPRTDPLGFRAILQMADVVLDTLHWSGGNTSLDALACGIPIVTLPGKFMRGRQSCAMLRAMDLPELVADTPEAYVTLALHLASEPGERAKLGDRIRRNRGQIFDRPEPIAALTRILEDHCAG